MTTSTVSRRDFFKAGGLASLAAGVAGLGIGSVLGVPEEAVAETITVTDFVYTCPVCGAKAVDYEALVQHFEDEHPDANCGIPQCVTLNINNNEIKVQVEPQWTLRETLFPAAPRKCAIAAVAVAARCLLTAFLLWPAPRWLLSAKAK